MVLPVFSPDQIESRAQVPLPSKNGVHPQRLEVEIRVGKGNRGRLHGVVRIDSVVAGRWIKCNLADVMAIAQKRKRIGLREFFKIPVSADGYKGLSKELQRHLWAQYPVHTRCEIDVELINFGEHVA